MKTKMFGRCLVAAMLLVGSGQVMGADAWFGDGPIGNIALDKAHRAYLNGKLQSVSESIREVLMDPKSTEVEKNNAIELYEQASVRNKGKGCDMPADWKMPQGLQEATISTVTRRGGDSTAYQIQFKTNQVRSGLLEQFQVLKYPDQVLLDKQARIGEWEESVYEGQPQFKIESAKRKAKFEDGLYLVNFIVGGVETEGWFILNDANSSATPVMHTPAPSETVTSRNPTISFDDFTSPEYKSCEKRRRSISVGRVTPGSDDWEDVWEHYEEKPSAANSSLEIGADTGVSLEDGDYWASLRFNEQRMQGDLKIRRTAIVGRSFRVEGN